MQIINYRNYLPGDTSFSGVFIVFVFDSLNFIDEANIINVLISYQKSSLKITSYITRPLEFDIEFDYDFSY